ncbi:hypothetical protein CRYUN_Cryun05aG0202900 [Craigia yunnanensis]
MAQPGESNSKGKAVASSEPKPEFKCPRCSKIFHSTPALCGHQNAHRLVKEPRKMSPVLAAVLNNPLPPNDKPVLISPRYHPYKRLDKAPIQDNPMEEINSYSNHHKNPDGEDFLRQLLEKNPQYHPYEMVLPGYSEEYSLPQRLTMDLLGEWMPISGFGDHGQLGTSSGKTLSDPILRNYPMEGEAGLQIGLRTSSGHLDLELKLGF